jgi:hypothetical protein
MTEPRIHDLIVSSLIVFYPLRFSRASRQDLRALWKSSLQESCAPIQRNRPKTRQSRDRPLRPMSRIGNTLLTG